ncbi:glycosyltransferase family 4 protein, partial [uncultured Salegentibacter sp.]|uniref:glycosyltransferase family 4 protein n=1 Tax=uncultured Salegentibacter sp. TaxID=259320 RepID=UPI0030D73A50
MHIAFLTPEYPHTACNASGGLGTSIKNLAYSLVKNDVEVSLVIYDQKSDRNFEEDGIRFYLMQQKKYKLGGWYFYRKYLQNFLNELSKEQHVDIIEAADWTGITAFMQLNVPLIIRLHGSDTYFCALEQREQKWKNRWFEEKALKNADHLISVSAFTGNKTVSLFNLRKDFFVIPNGIDIEEFDPFGENAQPNQLFYFGSLIRKKGILELPEIFNIIISKKPDAQLIVAGRDVIDIKENESTLKLFKSRLQKRARHNFAYLGEIPYQKIKNVLSNSAVVVLPSFAEALPMTWIEAMAM